MCGDHVGIQDSEPVEIFHRGQPSVKFLAVIDFLLGLAKVNVQLEVMFFCEIRYPEHQFFAGGINRVECRLEHPAVLH